ncbi:MAG TPA: prepilin-type N-terminal cleavage/methylation domain-containing protein [Gemmatimonadaceae bacterium]|nr:prepilin-type N-terminal cleavage/methylation domain-containing protein [Gemmatimonadaceae bacterium]
MGSVRLATVRHPPGFTLVEMLVAVTLTMLVFAITIPFFRAQTSAVGTGAGRLDALQNARYAQDAIDRELRRAGGVFGQPVIVQAAPLSITFNVDFNAPTATSDPNAAYYNASLDTLTTESFLVSQAKTLPTSSKTYPTATYTDSNGTRSRAETVSFFLVADASSGRSDIYTLYRRVNAKDSTVVTSNLWIPADTAYFFRYYRLPASGAVTQIAQSSLPLYWDDATRTIDSIAVVEMRIAGWYHNPRDSTDTYRTVYQRTRLANARTLVAPSCGAVPAAPTAVTGTVSGGTVAVAWTASTDDGAGASDVVAYSVMRRLSAGTTWTGVGNVPARSSASYAYTDYWPKQGTWVYGVAAVDCGPGWSTTAAQSGTAVVP